MTVSNSLYAYEDCFGVLDAALADEKGLRMRFDTPSAAVYFRLRCHYARKLDREKNKEVYPKTDLRHGMSQYDKVTIRLREDGDTWLYFEKITSLPGEVESLSGAEVKITLEYVPPKALPPPPAAPDLAAEFDEIEPVDGQQVLAPTPTVRRPT